MKQRKLGQFEVSEIGFGCMNLSHAYGTGLPDEEGAAMLNRALDLGINFLDTAALYGGGKNEELLSRTVMHRRDEFVLASKCGMFLKDGKKTVGGTPEDVRRVCEESLQRLGVEVIDLYYLHRRDFNVPIEDSVGEMSRLVEEGKIQSIGLSECSAETLRKAHAVYPVAAMQTEYSLWTRNAEIAVLDACEELDVAFVAFSPLARGFLCGEITDPKAQLEEKDIRHNMPRFYPENYPKNLELLDEYMDIAKKVGCTPAQLALAWLLHQRENIIPIPGTKQMHHLEDDAGASGVSISEDVNTRLNALINQQTVTGTRYTAAQQTEIDTEEF